MMNDTSRLREVGSTLTVRQVHWLKISVAVMTVLIVLGLGAVAVGMMRQAARLKVQAAPPPAQTNPYALALDPGPGEMKSVLTVDKLVVIHWSGDRGDVILSVDPLSGKEVGRIVLPRR